MENKERNNRVKFPTDLPSEEKVAKQIREIIGISQKDLAKIANMSPSTVKRAEKNFRNRTEDNQMNLVLALYEAAGFSIGKLLK